MGLAHEDKTVEERQELLIQAVRDSFKLDEHFTIVLSSNEEDTTLTCQAFGASSASMIGAGIVSFMKDQPAIKQVIINELTKMMMSEMMAEMSGEENPCDCPDCKTDEAAIPEPASTEKH